MKALLLLFSAVASAIWRGFVLSKLWLWYPAAIFGVPSIGIAQGVGISAMVSFLTFQFPEPVPEKNRVGENERIGTVALASFIVPAIALATGYAAKLFV